MTAKDYISTRCLPPSVVEEWLLWVGWGEKDKRFNNRLIIPIFSYTMRLVAKAGRALSDETKPKYLNTSFNKQLWLYGLWRERVSIPVLVEGYLDVWALALMGYNGYAVMGSGLSDWQAMHIAGMSDKAIIYPHADADGIDWAEKLQSFGVRTMIPSLLYPTWAPRKEDGCDETADPHWLYVNDRRWLEMNLGHCSKKLKQPTLEEMMTCTSLT